MNPLVHHFVTMAYNNAWANHRLLRAVGELSHDDFSAARTSFFPSLKATLNHIVTVDWYYVDALEHALRDEPVNAEARSFFEPEEPFATFAPLRDAQVAVDRRLIALAAGIAAEQLELPVGIQRKDGISYDSVTRLLAHLFEHQIHHRGQAHAMLAGTSVAPPQLDEFFCVGDAPLRAEDFAELGFSEDRIWRS